MKALVLSAALLLPALAGVNAMASLHPQVDATHHANPHRAALRLGRTLNLSPDQQTRLEPILAERQQKADAIRANTQLSDVDRHQQMKAMHRATRAEMSSVLTPDQMRQMKAMHRARHAAATPSTGV